MIRRLLFAVAALALLAPVTRADVKLHPLFSDGLVLQQGKDTHAPVWGTADPEEKVSVTVEGGERPMKAVTALQTADKDGRWAGTLHMAGIPAGGPYTMTVAGKNTITIKEVYVGEVWLASGQSNMEQAVKDTTNSAEAGKNSKNTKIRLFTVERIAADKPQDTIPVVEKAGQQVKGKWVECGPDTVGPFSAVAYHFAKKLQKDLDVPVGIIHSSWGGTASEEWTSMKVLDANPEHKGKHPRQAKLYNGMIAPLIPYAIKGAIWYQGESNAGRAELYRTGFPLMIENWRKDWNQGDFPFLFVQLAPFMQINKEPADSDWARLREAQLMTSQKTKNTAMAVITDVGDEKDIHPRQKAPVGERLAVAAEALAYGKKIEYSGPQFDKLTIDGAKAVLSFTHLGGGLVKKGDPLTGFTIAGEDKVFHNAEAEIKNDTIVVSSKDVEKPVAVRFGWANYPVVNLWNKADLPASPFRTDDWPKAAPKKP